MASPIPTPASLVGEVVVHIDEASPYYFHSNIAISQASLQHHLGRPRAFSIVRCKVPPCPFTVGDARRREPSCFQFPSKIRVHRKSRFMVRAVATVASKSFAGNGMLNNVDAEIGSVKVKSLWEDSEELDAKEKMRRMRISKANRGLTPWNKGRKHSPETIQRIKERTKLAMQDPKIKMKLNSHGHPHREETKIKISQGVRTGWQKRREKQLNQETCYYEWQNLIADTSRNGYTGEEELQWNSYQILTEKIAVEWMENIELRRTARPKRSRRALKSPEQKKKIAEAIAAKWADPEYRGRVSAGMARYYGSTERAPKKPKQKPSDGARPRKQKTKSAARYSSRCDKPSAIPQTKVRSIKGPTYKDPMSSSKLKMIKNIRAQRAAEEIKRTEAISRARLLIAEAEKAANALEVAAATSPIARASLLESRKLIAEAVKSIESISGGEVVALDKNSDTTLPNGMVSHTSKDVEAINQGSSLTEISSSERTQKADSTNEPNGNLNFSMFAFQSMLNGNQQLQTSPQTCNGFVSSPFSLETLVGPPQNSLSQLGMLELNGSSSPLGNGSQAHHTKEEDRHSDSVATTKKWVRGRLVETSESS